MMNQIKEPTVPLHHTPLSSRQNELFGLCAKICYNTCKCDHWGVVSCAFGSVYEVSIGLVASVGYDVGAGKSWRTDKWIRAKRVVGGGVCIATLNRHQCMCSVCNELRGIKVHYQLFVGDRLECVTDVWSGLPSLRWDANLYASLGSVYEQRWAGMSRYAGSAPTEVSVAGKFW